MQIATPPDEKSLQQTVMTAKTVSFVLMSSIFMFGLILRMKGDLQIDLELLKTNFTSNPIAPALTFMGVVCFALHIIIPKLITKNARAGHSPLP